jgi:Uma2 family endonuclease
MQTAVRHEFIDIDDYLAGEQRSDARHEYLGGTVYAMAGGSSDHHQIALNIAFPLRAHLKGRPCRVFVFDFKVRLGPADDVFYYPDVMVGCDSRDTHQLYLRFPKVLVEVSSDSTQRLDRQEKRLAYQAIETLEEYVIVAQERIEVTLFRRTNNWQAEIFDRPDQTLFLHSIGLRLSLSAIYDGVKQ